MQNVQLGRTKGNLARRKGGVPGYDTPDPKPGSPVVGAGPTGLSAGSRKGVSPNLKTEAKGLCLVSRRGKGTSHEPKNTKFSVVKMSQ